MLFSQKHGLAGLDIPQHITGLMLEVNDKKYYQKANTILFPTVYKAQNVSHGQ